MFIQLPLMYVCMYLYKRLILKEHEILTTLTENQKEREILFCYTKKTYDH